MSDAAIFLWFMGGLFVLRIIAATFVYAWLLSEAPECPACDGETIRVERRGVAWLFPRLRPSWCPECSWEGMLQPIGKRPLPPPPFENVLSASRSGRLPLVAKKPSE